MGSCLARRWPWASCALPLAAMAATLAACRGGPPPLDPAGAPSGEIDLRRAAPGGAPEHAGLARALASREVVVHSWDLAGDEHRLWMEGVTARVEEGALRGTVDEGRIGTVARFVRSVETGGVTTVRIRAALERGGELTFRWRMRGAPDFVGEDARSVRVPAGLEPTVCEAVLSQGVAPLPEMESASGWRGTIDAVRLDVPADSGRFALGSVELVRGPSREERLRESVRHGLVEHAKLGATSRVVVKPGTLRVPVALREPCRLSAFIGVMPPAAPGAAHHFEVRFEPDGLLAGGPEVLFSRTLQPGLHEADREWIPVEVPLAGTGRLSGTLVLESSSTTEGGVPADWDGAVWGDPRLIVERAPPSAAPNVVLISLDTLRADAVGAYGDPRGLTPWIDRLLARQGAVLADARAPASWTLPSHVSLFTGLSPLTHGVVTGENRLRDHRVTLAEALGERGYRTVAVTGGANLAPEWGFDQGFDSYTVWWDLRSGVDVALRQVAASGDGRHAPLFLFFHTTAIHTDYRMRFPYAGILVGPPPSRRFDGRSRQLLAYNALPSPPASAEEASHLRDLYDTGVAFTDHHVARLLKSVERAERREGGTVVALVSDHGEGFLEHGVFEHGTSLHDELLRVPLILRMAGRIPGGRVVLGPTSLMDVLPTLCELLEVPARAPVDGRSLADVLERGGAADSRPLVASLDVPHRSVRLFSLVDGDRKLVWAPDTGHAETFDLAADPAELAPLPPSPEMQAELALRVARMETDTGETLELSAQTLSELEALGYIE